MDAALKTGYEAHTVDEIIALPEGERAELINGVWYNMSAPGTDHQRLVGSIYRRISNYIEAKGGKCEPFVAPFAVFLNKDKYNYVEPDISVICDKDKLKNDGCHGAPDWIIEIVSPASYKMDYMIKMLKYGTSGVSLYWIVDPAKKMIRVLDYKNEETFDYTFEDVVPAALYQDFEIDFKEIASDITG